MKKIPTGTETLYTPADLVRKTGVKEWKCYDAIVKGELPRPTHQHGTKCYYTEAEFRKIIAAWTQADGKFTAERTAVLGSEDKYGGSVEGNREEEE